MPTTRSQLACDLEYYYINTRSWIHTAEDIVKISCMSLRGRPLPSDDPGSSAFFATNPCPSQRCPVELGPEIVSTSAHTSDWLIFLHTCGGPPCCPRGGLLHTSRLPMGRVLCPVPQAEPSDTSLLPTPAWTTGETYAMLGCVWLSPDTIAEKAWLADGLFLS